METEEDKKISFLDVIVEMELNGKLGHKVYLKSTHTDRYVNKYSNHNPRHKRGMNSQNIASDTFSITSFNCSTSSSYMTAVVLSLPILMFFLYCPINVSACSLCHPLTPLSILGSPLFGRVHLFLHQQHL